MHATLLGDPLHWPKQDLVGVSAEFSAPIAVEAYASGVFPMPLDDVHMGWWSPMERGIFELGDVRVTRSLRQSARRYTTTIDAAFGRVLERCADPSREGGWIDRRIRAVYMKLHEHGIAHSVETWSVDGELVGGLYGVNVRGLFAGESMFHDPIRGRDASKVALLRLVAQLRQIGATLLDTQWVTPHLASLGAIEITREAYLARLNDALDARSQRWEPQAPLAGAALLDSFFSGS